MNNNNLNHYTSIFDEIPALIAILKGPTHIYEYANNWYKKSVRKDANIIGLPIREALPELNGQGVFEIFDDVFSTGKITNIKELKTELDIDDDGKLITKYFSVIFKPIFDDQNIISGIFIYANEITELLKAKLDAEQSKEQLENMIMNAPVATALYYGKDMKIVLANDKMIKVWGKDKSIIGKKLADALPELDGQPFLDILDDVFETGQTYLANEQKAILEVENELRPYWFNFSYKPLYNKQGEVYAILNMALDVSYQVEAKNKLALSEEKLRSAIEVANLGSWEFNPYTKKVILNKTLLDWRGFESNDEITITDVLNESLESKMIIKEMDKAIKMSENGKIDVEYEVTNKNTGEKRRLHSQGKTFYNDAQKPMFVAGITQDVTTQRLTEKELENKIAIKTFDLANANDDLRKLNDNLEQFVYVASHDLQEPLRKINIFSDMLRKSSADINDEGKMYINKISAAARRMSLLISDLLEFSRIDNKEKIFIPTDLNIIIKNIQIDYELLIKQKNAIINAVHLPIIDAIPLQMHQLFYNLIGNALKFCKSDETCVINITYSDVDAQEKTALKLLKEVNFCKISITDNGIGFDQKYGQQIFEIFQRLHGKQEYAGTGIGLALSRKIAENHNGIISAISSENNGATFNIILPIKRDENKIKKEL